MSKLNILVAYPYMKKNVIEILNKNQDKIRFLLDSGAFTAWKAGSEIKLDDYCKFIENLPFKPWRYFTLDKIGDPEGSYENYKIMIQRGFNPIPIFTRGEDVSMIDEYYKTSDVVGIGGLVGTKNNKGFVKGIMKHIKGRKVHWLGFTSKNFITCYKPYSCDSSSFLSGARYGSISIYYGRGIWKNYHKNEFKQMPPEKLIDRLKYMGCDHLKLQYSNQLRGSTKNIIGEIPIKSHLLYQYDLQKIFKVKYFLAIASSLDLESVIENYNKLIAMEVIK